MNVGDAWVRAIAASCVLAGIGTIIESAEFIAIGYQFGKGGIFDRTILRTRARSRQSKIAEVVLGWVFAQQTVIYSNTARILMVVLVGAAIFSEAWTIAAAGCGLLIATRAFQSYRNVFGGDGADQVLIVVWIGLFVELALCSLLHRASFVGLIAIAAQSTLSYAVSGIAKLISKEWRNGEAATLIFRTQSYGHPVIYRAASRSRVFKVCLCWTTIAYECFFPAWILMPRAGVFAILAAGVIFHASNAVFMRLNVFFWAFVSTYPAIWFCAVYRQQI